MKLLVLLFLVGYAAANIYAPLDDAAEEFYRDFMLGMEEAGSLREALDFPFDHPLLQEAEDETKKEIADRLRETLDEILEKMKDSLERGKMFKEDLQAKLDEVKAKLKELKIDMGDKAKELMEKVKDRVRNFFRDLLEKLKGKEKRSFEEQAELNLRDMFKNLKKLIMDKIDKEKLKTKVEEIFGKGSEMADSILKVINEKGDKYKQKILDFIDRFLGKDDSKRSVKEVWEKIKDYFKDLHIDLKEKYMKFGEWVKEIYDKGLEKGKTKMENIRNIAREFIDHTKGVSKEVAVEALEFLKPYKEDLGRDRDRDRDRERERDRDYDRDYEDKPRRNERYNRRDRYDRNRDFERGGRELERPPREEEYEEERPRRVLNAGAAIAPPPSLLEPAEKKEPTSIPTTPFATGSSVAARIMAKYGFKEGQGLGKKEQGMSQALQVEKTSKRGGKIIHEKDLAKIAEAQPPSPPQFQLPPPPPPSQSANSPPSGSQVDSITEIMKCPSKVVLLRNMVGPGEVDEDLEPETKEECGKYGDVVKCIIFEIPGGNVPEEESVRIFVEFKRLESAIKAVVDLNGRYFGGRVVKAGFYDVDKFQRLELAE